MIQNSNYFFTQKKNTCKFDAMEVKDYYRILEIPPHANAAMVKKAYRKLALSTHPDKNPHNPNALAEFQLIQEAYTVLSTPTLKEAYLSQRWYIKSQNIAFSPSLHTPDALLAHLMKLSATYRFKNLFQIDYNLLTLQLEKVLDHPSFPDLQAEQHINLKSPFIKTFYALLELLPYSLSKNFISKLIQKLPENDDLNAILLKLLRDKKREAFWHTYKYLLVLLLVMIFIGWLVWLR